MHFLNPIIFSIVTHTKQLFSVTQWHTRNYINNFLLTRV